MRPLEMALNRQYTPTDTATKSAHSAITIHRVISFFPDFFSETDLFFFFCQVIFLNFFTVYIVFEESFLGTYPDNTVKIILVKRVYDWIIRYNMLVEYLIFGYDMNCSGLIG